MRVRVLSVPDKKGQSAATMITVALNKAVRVPDLHENIVSIGAVSRAMWKFSRMPELSSKDFYDAKKK